MGLFDFLKRGSKMVEARANDLLDNMEDPVTETKQGIRDMERTYKEAFEGQAEVKQALNLLKINEEEARDKARTWEENATALNQKIETSGDPEGKLEKLLVSAIDKMDSELKIADSYAEQVKDQQLQYDNLAKTVKDCAETIAELKRELVYIESSSKAADASLKVNKNLSKVDTESAANKIARMKEKVKSKQAKASAYRQINNENKSVEDEIKDALGSSSSSDRLAQFRNKLKKD